MAEGGPACGLTGAVSLDLVERARAREAERRAWRCPKCGCGAGNDDRDVDAHAAKCGFEPWIVPLYGEQKCERCNGRGSIRYDGPDHSGYAPCDCSGGYL